MDIKKIREQFPILKQKINGHSLVYLDSAATSQKPQCVIDSISKYYEEDNSNIHRSMHTLADRATEAYEKAREKIAKFIGGERDEIVFVRNSNEGINVVAGGICELIAKLDFHGLGRQDSHGTDYTDKRTLVKSVKSDPRKSTSLIRDNPSDEKKGKRKGEEELEKITILTTISEHHANFVPWLRLQNEGKAEIKFIPINSDGEMDLDWLRKYFNNNVGNGRDRSLLAVNYVSNVTGVINPIGQIKKIVGDNALILVDAAQAVAHFPIDVKKLGIDFLVFSGHKVFGPTGTSVLWGRRELLEILPPLFVGSSMIGEVTVKNYTLAEIPTRFEAGTPDIAGAVGLGEAVEWLQKVQSSKFKIQNYGYEKHEKKLLEIAIQGLEKIPSVRIIGSHDVKKKSGLVSFTVDGIHPHDIAALLDKKGIAVRAGHHCAEPLHRYFGIEASVRMSLSIFNTEEEVIYFLEKLSEAILFLKK